mgnify:CR=1 FL=1
MSPLWKLIVLALFLWSAANTWQQLDQANRFIQQGPRFTAQDGLALCERVRVLEATAYGYRAVGKRPLTCDYLERK